jgi:ABC-type sugar transport system substrate-binding protein
MLERSQMAVVLFLLGLGLVLIGVLGVGAASATNNLALAVGAVLAVIGAVWWQMLRRSR